MEPLPNSEQQAQCAISVTTKQISDTSLRFAWVTTALLSSVNNARTMTASTGIRPPHGHLPDDPWLFSKSDLALTPSVLQGGLSPTEEKQRRFKGVNAIYRMGEYMRLPQHVMNTACIYLHRFYMRKPLEHGPNKIGHSHYEIAATCIFLACKVEESHRKLPSVIDAAMASFDRSPTGNQRWAERSFRADPASKVSSCRTSLLHDRDQCQLIQSFWLTVC